MVIMVNLTDENFDYICNRLYANIYDIDIFFEKVRQYMT